MGFFKEFLRDESDIKWYGTYDIARKLDGDKAVPSRWTIDREKKSFLVCLGGQGSSKSEIPLYFALAYREAVIYFEGFEELVISHEVRDGTRYEVIDAVTWKISSVDIPACFEGCIDEVITLLREALGVFGHGYGRVQAKAVNINIQKVFAG